MNKAAAVGLPAHERVYRQLRDLVLFGGLSPGAPVTIQGLVDQLGVGMTPVREGLRRLTAEGALESLGNRRILVPVLDVTRVDELTEARLALEPLLAERAADRMPDEGPAALAQIDALLDQAITARDVAGYLRQNHAFHACFYSFAQAPIMHALTQSLWLRFGPSLQVVCASMGAQSLPDRHKDLLSALRAHDKAAARAAIEADIQQGMALIRRSVVMGQGDTD